jgi:hypothetical protein
MRPRPGHHYRCHVCRLELVIDEATQGMVVPPIDEANNRKSAAWDRPTPPPRKRR